MIDVLIPFILVCGLVKFSLSQSRSYESFSNITIIKRKISSAIHNNLIGNDCEHEYLDSFEDLVAYSGHKLGVSFYIPTEREYLNYLASEGITLTRSNSIFGKGLVRGKPAAEIWAKENKQAWSIPTYHLRNTHKQYCVDMSKQSGVEPVALYTNISQSLEPYYIMKAHNVFIDDVGIARLGCGYLQGHEACETIFKKVGKNWNKMCTAIEGHIPDCRPSESKISEIQDVDTVFVITAMWDHNYHHYLLDSFMRLIRYIDFLKKNLSIKIHIRGYEKFADTEVLFRRKEEREAKKEGFKKTARELRQRINALMGLDNSRFISGPIRAKVAYFPRSIQCNSPISHGLEVRALFSELYKKSLQAPLLPLSSSSQSGKKRKKLILQYRHCATEAECKKSWRGWTDEQLHEVVYHIGLTYSDHEIVVMSSKDANMSTCLHCQIREYANADIILGLHGAGMTNVMFMKPNSLVIEIVGKFDGRMLPLCGYHGPLAAMYGVHHYLFYYDWKGGEILNPAALAEESFAFYQFIQNLKDKNKLSTTKN